MASSITKNGRIQWKGRVQKHGEIKQKMFKTKKEALEWEAEERKRDWAAIDTALSISEWAQEYLDYSQSRHSYKTYMEKKKSFREMFAAKDQRGRPFVNPDGDVSTLTSRVVLKVLQVRFKAVSGYAANKDRKNLVAAWNWGVKYLDLPETNPCRVDIFPEIRTPRYIPPEEDFWKIYDLTSGQDHVMLSAFLYLGARRGEIFRLLWTDIDFSNDRVRLATRKRRDGTLEYDWLPMNRLLKEQLQWWWEHRTFKESTYVFVCEDQYDFCKEYYGEPFTKRRHLLKRLCEKAGVVPFGFHAIRHLIATKLYHMGKPLGAIQAILRHKSAATTERYLKSLGLEETRVHLEDLCDMRKPPKGAVAIENESSKGKAAEVIKLKDHLERRSQVVEKEMAGKTVSETVSTASGKEADSLTY